MNEIITTTLTNVVLGLVSLLFTYLMLWIRKSSAKAQAETARIKDEQQRSLVQTALGRLDDVARKTVHALEQTAAKELRQLIKDGGADRASLTELAKQARSEILRTLEPEYTTLLRESLGDFNAYITSTIEAEVLRLKEEPAWI